MGFNIFAAGVPDFHYQRNNNPDDYIFEAAEVMNSLRASGPSATGVASGVAEYVTPNSYLGAVQALARIQFLRLMKQSVDLLAIRPHSGSRWISVSTRESHVLWVDDAGFGKYQFFPGSDPGTEFFEKIKKPLEDTDLNNYGVLRMIAMVVSMYHQHLDRTNSRHVMLSIELSH